MVLSTSLFAENSYKYVLTIEIKQSHFSLNPFEHIKDSINKTEIKIPVDKEYYDSVSIGDNLIKKKFRAGSFIINGSIGDWELNVTNKEIK
jgi:hypothetical protein